jgi:outer membrane protein, multidrug efflux system
VKLHLAAAALACLALGACATARKPDATLPAAYEAPQAPVAGAADLDRWWTAFGDPELTRLIETALVKSPDARSAAARLEEARAIRAGVLTRFLPQGDLSGQARRTTTEVLDVSGDTPTNVPGFTLGGTTEQASLNFNVSWELDLFGRLFAGKRAADADTAAVRFSYEGTRSSLAANVADSYFQARGLAIQLEDARETARIRRGLLDIAQKRADRGLTATSETDRAAGDLSQAEAQVTQLEAELTAARRSLLVLVGTGVDPLATLPITAELGPVPAVPAQLPGALLARRPDVREAEARIRGQVARLRISNLALFPTFTLTPGVGLSRSEQPGLTSVTQSWSIGGAFTQPILDIPRLLTEIRAQGARTEQAVIAYEKAVQTAYGEAENSLVRLQSARRQVETLTAGEQRAARAYSASQRRYQAGLENLTTTLTNEQAWRATRAQLTSARIQAGRQAVQAFKALGGGWTPGASGVGG